MLAQQLLGGRRKEYLSAVTGRKQPRHPVDGGSEVVPVSFMGGPRVQRHPRPQGAYLLPPYLREEGSLGRERRLQGADGSGESGAEGVTHGLEDETTMPFDSLPHDGVVTGQSDLHASRALLPQFRGTLYIREQE